MLAAFNNKRVTPTYLQKNLILSLMVKFEQQFFSNSVMIMLAKTGTYLHHQYVHK